HGTHVAGIVASTNDPYTGIAPEANIVAIKVLNSAGSGTTANVINGIDWCVNNASKFNISVISMSLGAGGYANSTYCDTSDTATADAIHNAIARNISVVVAAGNDGSLTGVSDPACISNVTVVGSTDKANQMSPYNRWGLPMLVAPGSSITSAQNGGGFVTFSGTSMATPMIAGAFALLRQFKRLESGITLTPSQIQQKLNDTGKIIDDTGNSGLFYPRINILAALLSFDTTAPNITFSIPTESNSTRITANYTFINITSNEIISNATLEWNGTNETMEGNGMNWWKNKTNLNISSVPYTFKVWGNDSSGNAGVTESRILIFNNTKPLIDSFQPDNLIADIAEPENLTFNITSHDMENSPITFIWYKNSSNFSFGGNYSAAGQYNISVIISDGDLSEMQQWILVVNNTNRAVNITSSIPASAEFTISEPENQAFNITFQDLDSDDLITTRWYVNGTLSAANSNYTFHGNYSAAGVYNITAIVSDVYNKSSVQWLMAVNNTNRIPIISSISINSTDFLNRTNGTLMGFWSASDIDGDSIASNEAKWYNNSIEFAEFADRAQITDNYTLKNQNWIFSARVSDGMNWSEWANSTPLAIKNANPSLNPISNIVVNETQLVDINLTGEVSATDIDNDTLVFNYSSPFNTTGQWLTTIKDARNYTIIVNVSDNDGGYDSKNVIVTVLDKPSGENDTIAGNITDIKTNIQNLTLKINGNDFNIDNVTVGLLPINFSDSGQTVASFDFNFSNSTKFNFLDMKINKTKKDGAESLVIRGIDLTSQSRKKTLHLNRTNTTFNSICVKDAEINSIDELTSGCTGSGSGEIQLPCDGIETSGFTCTLDGALYRITGLSHSGIKQISYDRPSDSGGNNNQGGSSSSSSGGGGGGSGGAGAFYICNMDWSCQEWSECSNGRQVRACSFVKVAQH
ncbi:S8 family serine peptidase, partial [Candidatus Woesearchaeota archaeon]|nr:S8 family serine peptidase [Candidatus Woesearchaeota archaeon]